MKTTDPQNEIFSIVDENDKVIGSATRGKVHKNKDLIHRSVGIFIFNAKGDLFLQKRSASKDTDPSKWTISCSGHVGMGGNYETAAHRELLEELKIDLHVKFLTKFLYKGEKEMEMAVLFKAYSDGPFTLLTEEISDGKFFSQDELIESVKTGKIKLSKMGEIALSKIGWT